MQRDPEVLDPENDSKARQFVPEAGIASHDQAFDADGWILGVALACAWMLTAQTKPAVYASPVKPHPQTPAFGGNRNGR